MCGRLGNNKAQWTQRILATVGMVIINRMGELIGDNERNE